jgi:hypothetical protein
MYIFPSRPSGVKIASYRFARRENTSKSTAGGPPNTRRRKIAAGITITNRDVVGSSTLLAIASGAKISTQIMGMAMAAETSVMMKERR